MSQSEPPPPLRAVGPDSIGSVGEGRPKGQIVIPKAMRDRAGMRPGGTVFLRQADDGDRSCSSRHTTRRWTPSTASTGTRSLPGHGGQELAGHPPRDGCRGRRDRRKAVPTMDQPRRSSSTPSRLRRRRSSGEPIGPIAPGSSPTALDGRLDRPRDRRECRRDHVMGVERYLGHGSRGREALERDPGAGPEVDVRRTSSSPPARAGSSFGAGSSLADCFAAALGIETACR